MSRQIFVGALIAVLGAASPTVAQHPAELDYLIRDAAAQVALTKRIRISLDLARKEYQLGIEAYQHAHKKDQLPKTDSTVVPTETSSETTANEGQPMVRTDTPPDTSRMDEFQSTEQQELAEISDEFTSNMVDLGAVLEEYRINLENYRITMENYRIAAEADGSGMEDYHIAMQNYRIFEEKYQKLKIRFARVLTETSSEIEDGVDQPNTSPLDDFQSTEQHESVESMLEFMERIAELEPEVRAKLLKARLLNTTLTIDSTTMPGGNVATWANKEIALATFTPLPPTTCRDDVFYVFTLFVPDAELLAWKRARDEYEDYAEAPIKHERTSLFLSGRIGSYTWETRPRVRCDDGHVAYDHNLMLWLSEYDIESIRLNEDECTASVQKSTRFFERMTGGWVKYYMGRGRRPKTHVCLR